MLLFWKLQCGRSHLKGHTQKQKAILANQSCEFHVGRALGDNLLKSAEKPVFKIIAVDVDWLSVLSSLENGS